MTVWAFFAGAGKELFRVPSTISYTVGKLAEDPEVPLFERAGPKAGLTSACQEAALSPMLQPGAACLTTIAALLEFQRTWKNKEHYNALMSLLKQQGGAYGIGEEYAYMTVHHASQFAQWPQVVNKEPCQTKAFWSLRAPGWVSLEHLSLCGRSCL